jgi:hypothetical protein
MRVRAKPIVHEHVVDEFDHQHITPSKEYIVIGFDDEYFRVIDDADHPILYPRALFDVVDPSVPDDWVRRDEPDGSYYVDPPECSAPGFYEDVFDQDADAIAVLRKVVRRLLGEKHVLGSPGEGKGRP